MQNYDCVIGFQEKRQFLQKLSKNTNHSGRNIDNRDPIVHFLKQISVSELAKPDLSLVLHSVTR
jgi:hypothetical protein